MSVRAEVELDLLGERRTLIRTPPHVDGDAAVDLRQRIIEHIARGETSLCLDLSVTTFIDSAGLGAIVGGLKRTKQAGGNLTIAGPCDTVKHLLKITGLDRVLGMDDLS